MPLDETNYTSASDYHDALDQQMGITPIAQRYSGQTSADSYRAPAPAYTPSPRTFTPYQMAPRAPEPSVEDPVSWTGVGFTFRPEEGTPEHGTYMSDYAKAAWNGARQMGADLMGAADYATRQLSEDPTAQTVFRRAQASLEGDIENSVASMSPAAQKALHASLFGNDPNAPSVGDVGWGRYLAINAASQVPMLLSFLIPSTIGAKVAIGAAKAMGAGVKAAEVAGAVGRIGATGTFFGAQNAGAVYNDIVKQVTDASDKEMMKAPGYAAYREQGMGVTEAKEQVIQKIAGFAVSSAGLVGAVAGAGVGGIVRRGALGAIESRVANAGIGAAEGGALMGGQGAANEALSQRTGQQLGTQQGYDVGKIIAQAVSAGIPGALFGAAGGVFHKPEPRGIEDTRGTGGVAPDVRAATEAALGTQGELDLSAAPSGIPAGQQQGELFRTQQEANPPLGKDATSPPMTGAPATPPPPSTLPGGTGMPGARQGELPITQTPPGIVPTTGQGEMFPSVPQMNPPRPDATVAPPVQPPVVAGPVGGTVATGPTVGAAPVRREPTGAAAPGTRAGPVDVKQLPAFGKKRDEMIDELVGLTGRKPSSFKGQTTTQIAAVYNREMARQGAGTGAVVESTPPPAKLAAAKPIEQARAEAKPVTEAPVGELPLPDQPGGALSPQAAVAPAAEPATARGEAPAGAAPPPVGGFTTEKGSTYQVHEDGTTTRDKAFRPEHGVAEQGPQPRSEHTFYVSPEDAQKLGEFQTRGGGDKILAPIGDGRWGVKYTSGKDAGKVEARTVVTPKAHPEAGAIPVELWNNGERVHFGNKITEMREPVTPGVKPEPEAKLAALQTKAGVEQAVEEKPPIVAAPEARVTPEAAKEVAAAQHAAETAPKAAKAVAVSKRAAEKAHMQATGVEIKPVDQEAIAKAKTTRDAELKAAEEERQKQATEKAAEKLALVRQKATEQREQTIRTTNYGVKQEHRPDTTDYERIQGELVDRIARGEISGADAHAEYEQGRRKGGRQRREEFDTVAKGIERELAVAQNKDVELALLKQQQEHEANPKGTPKQREKRTNDLEEQLKHFDPTRIERLQDALKEIRDPVGHAADRASPLESTHGPKPTGIDPMGSRYTRLLRDPRLSGSITRALKQAHQDGIPLTLHNLLRTVAGDPLLRNEARPLVALAERFLKISRDISVMSGEHAYDLGHIDARTLARMERGGLTGHYHPTHDHIVLSMHHPEYTLTTLMHEASHSITQKLIDHMQRTDPSHPQLQALDAIRQEIHRAYEDSKNILGPETRDAIEYALNAGGRSDAVYHELHTALLTDPKVHGFVASQQASPQFAAKMRSLGYGIKPGRSVWQAFTGWMRKALGMPEHTSGSEVTIFDHIMRPVSDITEHAAQYNERTRPRDAALERHAAPLERASRDYLRDAGRGVADRIDTKSIPDKLRRMVVNATNVDAIERHNKEWLSGLTGYRVARDKIAAASAAAATKYGDRVRGLLKQWGRLPDQKAAGQLMNDASIGEAYLGKGVAADANAHLSTPEQQTLLRELQARYDKLSPAAKEFYNDSKDLYKELYKDRRDAELTGSLRSVIPDITPAQEEAFVKAARNQKALAEFMANPDNSDVAKAFGTDWSKNRDLAKVVARSHSYGYVKGDYFPQRRYGNYVVRYGEDEKGGVEFFDKKSKAEARRKELIAQYGPKDVWQVTKHNQKFTRDILANHPAVAELETALANKGFTGAQAEHARDTLASILVNHMANSAAQKMRLKRQGVMGADINHNRVLANEFVNHVNRQGYLLHGAERQATLDNLWSQQHDFERPIEGDSKRAIMARDIIQSLEARQMRPEEMNNAKQRFAANVNALNYAMQLMSPSHMVTSTMESHTNSIALLGGRHGVFKSSKTVAANLARVLPILGKTPDAMLKAMTHDLKSAHWNVLDSVFDRLDKGGNKKLNDIMRADLKASGLVDHTMMSDLHQQMNPEGVFGGKVANAWERLANTNAIMAHYVDAMNRVVTYKSAFELEYAKSKGDIEASRAYADKVARQVAPNYMTGNRELITTPNSILGKLGAPLMQFKRYGLHMYAMMGTLIKESIHSGTSAERWEARKSLALLMGTHAMMAGVLGLPTTDAIRYIGGAVDLFQGRDPRNYENWMRRGISDVFGKTAGELIARGLPHALGFDVHRRVSLNNLLEMPELSSFGKSGIQDVLFHLATGATGEDLVGLQEGAAKLVQGDVMGAAKTLIPRIVRDPIKAINLASQGVTDSRGHTVLPPAKLSPYDIGLQAVGFQPSRVSETREGRNAVLEARQEQSAERSHLEQRYLSGNASDKAAAWQAIVEYNSRNPTARITRQQLLQQQQAEKRSGATFGLRLPKKGTAALMQAGAFANAN